MTFLGIDLHGDRFTCCYLNEGGIKHRDSFKLEEEDLARFYATLDRTTHVLIEASDRTYDFVELFRQFVAEVVIVNAHKLKLISLTDKGNDSVETHRLATIMKSRNLSYKEQIHPVLLPPKLLQDLRLLFFSFTLIREKFTSACEAPELIELGIVTELANYDVSVKVGTRKEGDDHEA